MMWSPVLELLVSYAARRLETVTATTAFTLLSERGSKVRLQPRAVKARAKADSEPDARRDAADPAKVAQKQNPAADATVVGATARYTSLLGPGT